MIEVDRDPNNNPTFIPYTSSLDLVNGISKFSTTIQANSNYFHDQFPPEVVTALIGKLLPLSVNISGPTSLGIGQKGTWNESAIGGFSPYTYQWYYEYPGGVTPALNNKISPNLPPSGTWYAIGTNSPTLSTAFYATVYLKCVVTDANNNSIASIITVNIGSAKVAQQNNSVSAQLKLAEEKVPTFYEMNQNYPNPFNPSTVINYQLPKAGFVSLKVYDIVGNVVRTLVNGFKPAGSYAANFDGSNLASGIYFYYLETNGYVST